MITRSVEIEFGILRDALEKAKTLKCDVVSIPSIVVPMNSSAEVKMHYNIDLLDNVFLGVYGKSIYVKGEFLEYKEPTVIININTLKSISLWSKDVNVFFREMDALGVNKDKVIIDLEDIWINGMLYTRGVSIRSMSTEDGQHTTLYLIDGRELITKAKVLIREYMRNLYSVMDSINIMDDEEFLQILSSKTAVGGQMWIPKYLKNSLKWNGHVITLANNFLNVSKGDSVCLSIKDDNYNTIPHSFIADFTVFKTKKKCILETYMWNLKVY